MKHRMIPHDPSTAPSISIGAKAVIVGSDVLRLEYSVVGTIGKLKLPGLRLGERRDELWRTTCFEAFVELVDGYIEINASPSRDYAVYRFDGYRDGGQPSYDLPVPEVFVDCGAERLSFTVWMDLRQLLPVASGQLGLSAVIEETDGTKSYWALAHAPGPPDFHNPACFTATLPAPDRP